MDDVSVDLVARWRSGDQQAATQLYERYAERLIALARRRLPPRFGGRLDPEDVVQSVYRSFFLGARKGRFEVDRTGDLWRLLTGITLNKLQEKLRHHSAGKRTVARETAPADNENNSGETIAALERGPTAEEAVRLADYLERLLVTFAPRQRRMIELRLQGYMVHEIATELGCCRHTVLRALDRFKSQLDRQDSSRVAQP